MVRVLGNSPERVEIKDLKDVIYYKQLKNFTDQEYENSKDLRREIGRGTIIKIETSEVYRGSVEAQNIEKVKREDSINIEELKRALREILPELKSNDVSEGTIKGAIRDIAPMIVEMVRQEISKIGSIGDIKVVEKPKSSFVESGYIPSVSTEGLKSNVKIKEKEVSADSVADNLAALRRLKDK